MIGNASDDGEGQVANALAALVIRVKWVKEMRAELARLADKYPAEEERITRVLANTQEWL